jgi:hypothetical protein
MDQMSSASLEMLNHWSPSPTSSTSSLDKFLSTPMSEEGASVVDIEAALRDSTAYERSLRYPDPPLSTVPRYFNTADSEGSVSSANSFQSWYSQRSVDSRGPRRGRKQWTRLHMRDAGSDFRRRSRDPSSTRPESLWREYRSSQSSPTFNPHTPAPLWGEMGNLSPQPVAEDTAPDNDAPTPWGSISEKSIFCTWPSCSSKFRYRSDWTRHEEALHYCPYHWVCCPEESHAQDTSQCLICAETNHTTSDHCGSCASKDLQSRTFLREDQLSQHIKRTHLSSGVSKPRVPKELLTAWKTDNPAFLNDYLRCGFCGIISDNWAQRQDHVFEHLRKGICKSSWWPARQPQTLIPLLP